MIITDSINMIFMDDSWRKRLKRRLAELKKSEGLTQEKLGEKIGVTQGTIGHWVNGRRAPESIEQFEKLANALNWHLAYLLYGDISIRDGLVVYYSGPEDSPSIADLLLSLPAAEREVEFKKILRLASLPSRS